MRKRRLIVSVLTGVLALAAIALCAGAPWAKDETGIKKITIVVHEGGFVRLIAGEEMNGKKEAKEGATTVFEFNVADFPAFEIVAEDESKIQKVKIDDSFSEGIMIQKFDDKKDHRFEIFFVTKYHVIKAICREGGVLDIDGMKISGGEKVLKFLEESLTITAIPSQGYELDDLLIDGEPVKFKDRYELKLKEEVKNVEVKAHFVLKTHKVSFEAGRGGSVTPSGVVKVKHGEKIEMTVKPDEGYQVTKVIVDLIDSDKEKELGRSIIEELNKGRSLRLAITESAAIDVEFGARVWQIKVKDASHGKISPRSVQKVKHGEESPKFEIEPESGYELDRLTDNGREVKPDGRYYQIRKVTEDHELQVTFKKKK